MDSTPRKVVLVIDPTTHELAKSTFARIKAAAASLGNVAVAHTIAQAFQHMALGAMRAAELATRIHGNVFFAVDEWPSLAATPSSREHDPDLAKLVRELREITAAPSSGSGTTNSKQRQRVSGLLYALAKPRSTWLAGFSSRPIPRQRRGNRHT